MLDGDWRDVVNRGRDPIGTSLRRTGITADMLTVSGIAIAAAAAVVIGNGYLKVGFLLLILTGIPDALDGAVAKAAGKDGPRGAYLDSVSDRLSDALLFAGAGWYLAGTDTPRMALLPFGIYIAASLVSYQRAKAEALGFKARGGLMERAERFIVLGFGLLFSPLFVATLWVMFVLTVFTAVARFTKVWRQASGLAPLQTTVKSARRRRNPRTASDRRLRAQARADARRRRRSNL